MDLWVGCFQSMDEARTAAGGLDEAYTSSEWINNLQTRLETARSGKYPRPSTLPTFLETHEVRSVIDFGGGNGWLAHLIDPKWWSEGGSYTVVEPEHILQYVTSSATEKVDFVSEQSLVARNMPVPRMVYALSSMQYLDTTQSLLELIASTRPHFVLLEDVPLSTSEEFCSNQKYHRWLIPYRFTNSTALINSLNQAGYALRRQEKYEAKISPQVNLQIRGASSDCPGFGGSVTFLFARK